MAAARGWCGKRAFSAMTQLLALAATLVLALAGLGLLRIIWAPVREIPRTAGLALGFYVGTFGVALLFYLAYVLGRPFTRGWLVWPTVIAAAGGAVVFARGSWRRPCWELETCLAVLLVVLALAVSWGRPVYGYDALSMWALKAKIAYYAQTWPATMFDRFTTHHPEYPPLVPSAQAFVFFFIDRFDDVVSRVVFAGFFASGAAILWWLLGVMRASHRGVWSLWWCALPVLMEQVKITYADLPLAGALLVFFGAGAAWWHEPERADWLRLAAVFGGLAFWIKPDALVGVGAGLVILTALAVNRRPVWSAWVIVLMMAVPWPLLVSTKTSVADFGWPTGPVLAKLGLIAREIGQAALMNGGHAFFWPLVVVTVWFRRRQLLRTGNSWLLGSLVVAIVSVLGVYLSTRLDLVAQLKTSTERVLLNLYVPALLLVAMIWRRPGAVLERRWWRMLLGSAAVAVVTGMFARGWARPSDEELFGVSISPYPLAFSWVWLVVGVLTIVRLVRQRRRLRLAAVWRFGQWAVMVATLGMAIVVAGVTAGEVGTLCRRFVGQSQVQQHATGLPAGLRARIAEALQEFPDGTHVRVTPKRSLSYHQFYYEVFPRLIVDHNATNTIDLAEGLDRSQ